MERVSLKVIGKVQGVFFRHEAKKIADGLGISGFVRNEKDGSVYIEAEGERSSLEKLLLWAKTGPRFSLVKEVIPVWGGELKGYKGFTIQ